MNPKTSRQTFLTYQNNISLVVPSYHIVTDLGMKTVPQNEKINFSFFHGLWSLNIAKMIVVQTLTIISTKTNPL